MTKNAYLFTKVFIAVFGFMLFKSNALNDIGLTGGTGGSGGSDRTDIQITLAIGGDGCSTCTGGGPTGG